MRTLYQGGIRLLVQARLALGSQALEKSMGIVEDVANDIKLCRDYNALILQSIQSAGTIIILCVSKAIIKGRDKPNVNFLHLVCHAMMIALFEKSKRFLTFDQKYLIPIFLMARSYI